MLMNYCCNYANVALIFANIKRPERLLIHLSCGIFMLKKFTFSIIFICSFLFSTQLYAMLDLELTQGVSSAIPIAIMPFLGEETIANQDNSVRLVINKDLQNSGKFTLASVDNLLPSIGNSGAINYDFWRTKKVDAVVTGKVQKIDSSNYQISFQLLNVYNKITLLDRQYKVPTSQLRALAHHISDLIYEKLIGDRGIFSTKIAYIVVKRDMTNKTAQYSLEVADADGFNPRNLLTSSQPLMSPAWSYDGTKIAYVSFEGNRAAIYVQDVATGGRQVLSNYPGINGAPAWSPDGKKMAVVLSTTGYPKIYTLDLASKNLTQITSDISIDTEPSWSPDGKSLLFTSNRGGGPQIYRVYIDSKKVERISYHGNYNARASFTADGKNVVMLHQDGNLFSIAIQDLDSGRLTTLTRSDYDESPSVAPNGKMIVYATNNNGRGVLAAVSSDGKVKLLLPAREGEVQEPAWSPFLSSDKQ